MEEIVDGKITQITIVEGKNFRTTIISRLYPPPTKEEKKRIKKQKTGEEWINQLEKDVTKRRGK